VTKPDWQQAREDEAARVEARVPGLKFDRAEHKLFNKEYTPIAGYGGAMPWQAEGTIDNKPFYARFRGDTAAMQVWDVDPKSAPIDAHGLALDYKETTWSSVIHSYTGEPYAGDVEGEDEVVEIMTRLIEALEPTHPETNPNSAMILARMLDRMHDSSS